jgi:hypothetical protein
MTSHTKVSADAIRAAATEELFQQYLAARDRADQIRRFEDGLAAGHAWRAFVDSFVTEAA